MAVEKEIIKCESIFSDDSLHRYMLSKVWDIKKIKITVPRKEYDKINITATNTEKEIEEKDYYMPMVELIYRILEKEGKIDE